MWMALNTILSEKIRITVYPVLDNESTNNSKQHLEAHNAERTGAQHFVPLVP